MAYQPFIPEALSVTHTIASPTVPSAATDGVDLSGAEGFRAILSAASGQTLSGAGTIDFYVYDVTLGVWVPNPDLQLSLTSAHSGVRRVAFADQPCFVPWGRVAGVPNGITVGGGTTCDLQLVVYRAR